MKPVLSVVISTYNEMSNDLLKKSVQVFLADSDIELILVGEVKDHEWLASLGKENLTYVATDQNSRADRLNTGLAWSSAQYVLFHHPRSIIDKEALDELKDNLKPKIWGGFTHSFYQEKALGYKFTSWYSNQIRFDLKKIIYLDHGIFLDRSLIKENSAFPSVDIFEDTLICYNLRKTGAPLRLKSKVFTSSVRFRKKGFLRQALMNQVLKFSFYFGASKIFMNKIYEKNLNLNSDY